MMDKKGLLALMQDAVQDKDLPAAALPQLDLYMDQVITLMENGFGTETPLTKTMINNYSKEKLIAPIKGKKYTREQVVEMLLIYHLKSTLSMAQIKQVMDYLRAESSLKGEQLAQSYDRFIEGKGVQRTALPPMALQLLEESGCVSTGKGGVLQAILSLCSMSSYCTRMATALLEAACVKAEEPESAAETGPEC